ncbi:uncharacterized protein N7459_002220 [Penicillium hispanicum]|uniref:uncharacterized protein n=1 Tax=Penicillium hispanicum TaxID=1080232 RepID=UPI00254162C4|nr:uncharacterized protein N7459_002220 [Penicillium hispanicum]KAJ5591851.1 hypothetical protein N7459_002220 [Penicillium hispanicum]
MRLFARAHPPPSPPSTFHLPPRPTSTSLTLTQVQGDDRPHIRASSAPDQCRRTAGEPTIRRPKARPPQVGGHLRPTIGTKASGRHFTSHLATSLVSPINAASAPCTPAEMAFLVGETSTAPAGIVDQTHGCY